MPPEVKAVIERGKAKASSDRPLGWTMVWQSLSEPVPSKVFETPQLRIASPAAQAKLRAGEFVEVEVSAGEGVPLTSVQLCLDSRPIAKLRAPPFQAVRRNVPPGTHTLRAVGYFAGEANRGEAAPVVFEVTEWGATH